MVARLQQELQTSPQIVRRRLPRITDNHASVVLRVSVNGSAVLLGGDLQVRDNDSFGWKAIIRDFGKDYASDAYKVAHHGSSNADDDQIWEQMLTPNPPALISPYVGGGNNLPTLDDCRRLKARTNHAYITAPPVAKRHRDSNPAVERTLKEATRRVSEVPGKFGHLRLRKATTEIGSWQVERFGDGMSIDNCIRLLEDMRHS